MITKISMRHHAIAHGMLLAGLIMIVLILCAGYLSSERAFYWADYANFEEITHSILNKIRISPLSALIEIIRSTSNEYNALFTLPAIPFLLIVGDSRPAFIMVLGVVYLVPLALVTGAIAVQLLPGRSFAIFWSTVGIMLLTPYFWVATLRGYPDAGAAFLVALAAWFYLRDMHLKRIWQIAVIGALLGTAVVFRRHFAYTSIAFIAAMGIQTILMVIRNWRHGQTRSLREALSPFARLSVVAVVCLLAIAVLGRSMLLRMITINYNDLYASYLMPAGTVLQWMLSSYGWIVVAGAFAGFVLGWRSSLVFRPAIQFLTFFAAIIVALWLAVVRQQGEHYTLHFTWMVVLGWIVLARIVIAQLHGAAQGVAIAGVACFLFANFVTSLAPRHLMSNAFQGTLFARWLPPLHRDDYDEVNRLVNYLRDQTVQDDVIYVAAYSGNISHGILINAERQLHSWDQARLKLLHVPVIDSRDFWPLEMLVDSDVVVIASPYQHTLIPEENDLIRAADDHSAMRMNSHMTSPD